MKFLKLFICSLIVFNCSQSDKRLYGEDVTPISKKTMVIELLSDNGKGRIAIAPEIQGKVLTTTYNGLEGYSNGWLNRDAFKNEKLDIANIGGEDRLWFGPLGSQHSFYYQQIEPLSEANWLVPPSLSSEPYKLVKFIDKEVVMSKQMTLVNFIGTEFNFEILRKIELIEKQEIEENLDITLDKNLNYVAYESVNSIENKGDEEWKKETGLVSIWNAGMFEGSNETVVIIPLIKASSLDAINTYMAPLDVNRLQLKNGAILFKADGKYRSKIGIPHAIAPSIYGSYSKDRNRLTIIQYRKMNELLYSNSNVSMQENPYKGEIIPIYNNGTIDYSTTDTTSFFELESTSAMVALAPKRFLGHYHRVYHFSGSENELNTIAEKLLGIQLKDCVLNSDD